MHDKLYKIAYHPSIKILGKPVLPLVEYLTIRLRARDFNYQRIEIKSE